MCVLSLKNYFPCLLFEKRNACPLCLFFPPREMMRMAMIWIVTRYYCGRPPGARGTAAANGPQSRGRGGAGALGTGAGGSHALPTCFTCNQGYDMVSTNLPVSLKFIGDTAMPSQITGCKVFLSKTVIPVLK